MKAGWILAVWMASSCIACCIFDIINIPFNCGDTALRVAEAMVGTKVKFLVSPCLLCFSNLAPEFVPESLAFSRLGNQAEISHMNPRRNSSWSSELMWRGPQRLEESKIRHNERASLSLFEPKKKNVSHFTVILAVFPDSLPVWKDFIGCQLRHLTASTPRKSYRTLLRPKTNWPY